MDFYTEVLEGVGANGTEADRNPKDEIDHSKEENTSEHAKGPDGSEGIVYVKITTEADQITTHHMKACMINYKELGLKCSNCPTCTCSATHEYMLLLPFNNNSKFEIEKIREIKAEYYNHEKRKLKVLKLVNELVEPEQLTHQFLPCSKEDKRTFKISKAKSLIYVSKYSKVIKRVTSKDQLGQHLFGIGDQGSSKDSRAKFVKLKFSTDQNGHDILEICDDESVALYPCGILFHKNPNDSMSYEVIGSYSKQNGKITFKLIMDNKDEVCGNPSTSGVGGNPSTTEVGGNSSTTEVGGNPSTSGVGGNPSTAGSVGGNASTGDSLEGGEELPKKNCPNQDGHNVSSWHGDDSPSDEQKHDGKPSSVQEGLVPISKKGKNPVKPAATTGGYLKYKTKLPSQYTVDGFGNPDATTSDNENLQLASNASLPAILKSEEAMSEKLRLLARLKERPIKYELAKSKERTPSSFEKLSTGIKYLSNEFMEEEQLIIDKLRKNESGPEIEKMIDKNMLRQEIITVCKESLELAKMSTNFDKVRIQDLENRIKDKEKTEKLREEFDRAETKHHELEKEKRSYLEQAKNEARGPLYSSIESLQEKERAEMVHLMEKSISCPEQTTLTELEEKMKYFIYLSKQRCNNFRKRSSESSDDGTPDAIE